jgi:hypothetical protein
MTAVAISKMASAASPAGESEGIGAAPRTEVDTVAASFAGSGSGVDALAVALFVRLPDGAVTETEIVKETDASGATVPTEAVTVPPEPTAGPTHVPDPTAQDRNTVPEGSGSTIATPTAAPGPRFITVTTYVSV